jgi:hypothetical protein
MKRCTQCGEPASIWERDLTTGICRKCRKAEAAEHPLSLSNLTLTGWLLTFVIIGVIVGLMIPYGRWLHDLLPGGRYPALLLALPVLIAALILFAVGALILKRLGMPVWKPGHEDQGQPPNESEVDG